MWGFGDYPAPKVLQNRINRFYMGVHKFASNACVAIEMNVPTLRVCRWLEILRYHNRVMLLDEHRLPSKIYNFDVNSGKNAWVSEVKEITVALHLPGPEHKVLYDIDVVQQAIWKYSKDQWWAELDSKPKLRTYQLFKERDDGNVLVKSNLPVY